MDKPILFDKPFPEKQVFAPYKIYTNEIMGSVAVTGGFMEAKGHSYKSKIRRAINRNGDLISIRPGNYNIGFDYTSGHGKPVRAMYSGRVKLSGLEGGYGNRIHIQLDISLQWRGQQYTCYQAYAHNSRILKKIGDRVKQGEVIANEGGTGMGGRNVYGSHVDLDTYAMINREKIHINFEYLALSLLKDNYIEQVQVMRKGSKGLGVKWLQKQLGVIVDGNFGMRTEAKLKLVQRSKKLKVDGIAGAKTCTALGITGYKVIAKTNTLIKSKPIQSSEIEDINEIYKLTQTKALSAKSITDSDKHWRIELKEPLQLKTIWYGFKEHLTIIKGF